MRLILMSVLSVVLLSGSIASAQSSADSLEGRTQLSATGAISYSDTQNVQWSAAATAIQYVRPHFGVGGSVGLIEVGAAGRGWFYTLSPVVEYFVPIAERQHVYAQGSLSYSNNTEDNMRESWGLGAALGYRYFFSDSIALGPKLSQRWAHKAGGVTDWARDNETNLLAEFSLFF